MYILYPPWANTLKETELPEWSVRGRHQWMSTALKWRRRLQSLGVAADESFYYHALLAQFYESYDLKKDATIFEILSDGLGDVEPFWHGLKVQDNNVNVISESLHRHYIEAVHQKRQLTVGQLSFSTHRDIGKKLVEPTLFKITRRNQVQYYRNGVWRKVDDADKPLTLKVSKPQPTMMKATESNVKSRLSEIFRDPTYKNALKEVERSLLQLSLNLLWPVLLNSEQKDGEPISLVLIHASTWQVPGVWALHALSPTGNISDRDQTDFMHLQPIIEPPILCLNDVMGVTYRRDSTHVQRQEDARLYLRSVGYSMQYTAEEEFYSHDETAKNIYDSALSPDLYKRYGVIYDLACSELAKDEERQKPDEAPVDKLLAWLEQALRQHFIAWAGMKDNPAIASLIIQECVRLCLAIIDQSVKIHSDATGTALPSFDPTQNTVVADARHWFMSVNQLTEAAQKFDEERLVQTRLLALSLVCVALAADLTEESHRKNLYWCGQGLRAIVLSADKCEDMPTRKSCLAGADEVEDHNTKSDLLQVLADGLENTEVLCFLVKLTGIN